MMETLSLKRLHLRDFPVKSYYCIQQKTLTSGYPLHQHDFFEIELVLSGKGTHFFNGKRYPISRGSVYFLSLNSFHEIRCDEPIEVITFMFSDYWINEAMMYRLLHGERELSCHMEEEAFSEMLMMANLLQVEQEGNRPLRSQAIRNLTELLLISLLRGCGEDPCPNIEQKEHPVSKVLLYLSAHFRENPSLGEVSALVNHNVNYFSELFHKTTGRSYSHYLSSLKLNHACKLLTCTDQSITDICLACGFNSYSGFSHAFSQAYGCSAREFRRRHKQFHSKL